MEPHISKRIAIVSKNPGAYSETFIKAQVELLPAQVFLHTGFLPTMHGTKYIQNKFQRFVNAGFKYAMNIEMFSLEKAIARILKKEKIDAVLAQYGLGGCAIQRACKMANIPLYVHFHGYDASEKSILESYGQRYKSLFSYANGFVSVSKKMTSTLIELGCPPSKIITQPCAPNDKFFNLIPGFKNNTFFGVGRFVDKKAHYLTLLAFKDVLIKVPDAKLVIAGDGILLNTCRNITKSYQLESSVSFPGILNPEEIMQLMQDSLAYVQHSVIAESGDSEGTPVAVLEASAAALPVIATNHGGIPDVIINNETGLLVDEFDIKAMSSAMLKLIENKELAKTMGLAGRERIKNQFSMDIYISKLRNLIK